MVYDGVYNPYEWFHVEFQWLVCTGCVVDDFLSMLERKAKNLGLRWIPIPVYLMDRSKVHPPPLLATVPRLCLPPSLPLVIHR